MTSRRAIRFSGLWLVFCFLWSFPSASSQGSLAPSVRFDRTAVSVTMKMNQRQEDSFQIINESNKEVHFSLIKTTEPELDTGLAVLLGNETEEYGSSWTTYRGNYQRQSCNPVESSIPPYALKWTYQGSKPLLSPLVSGDNLLIPSEDGHIYHIDSRTGIYRSRISFDDPITSLHLHRKYLVISTTTELIVYNRETQLYMWRKPIFAFSPANVVVMQESIFFLNGVFLVSANVATGNENWKISNTDAYLLLTDDRIITSNETGITCYDQQTGKLIWKSEAITVLAMPAELNQQVFYLYQEKNQAYLRCVQVDGKEIWSQTIPYPDINYFAIQEKYIAISTVSGQIACYDTTSGKQRWEYQVHSKIHVSPVIVAGHVYVGSNTGNLFALSLENGFLVWQTNTGFPIYNPLVLARGFIYITDAIQSLYAYGREWENVVPPEPPDQLKAVGGDKMVTLFWRHAKQTPDFAGYHLYRKTSDELTFSFIASIGIFNQYQDTGLKNNQMYHFLVRSYDTFGNESTNSNMISVTPKESSDLSWLLVDPTGGTINPSRNATIRLLFTSRDLPPGIYTAYLHCLVTDESLESSIISLSVSLYVLEENEHLLPLPKISSIRSSDTRVILQWESIPEAEQYMIYRSVVKNDELKLISTLSSDTLSYQDDAVTNRKTYYYYIKYKTDQGQESDFSLEATIIPEPLPITITYPTSKTLYEPVFAVIGTADPKATVYYQTWSLTVEADGRFTTTVGVNVGENKLVFRAIDTEGHVQEAFLEIQFITSYLKVVLTIGSSIVQVNDKTWPTRLDAPPIIQKDRTFVPLRFISEVIGAHVDWIASEQRVDIIKGNHHIVLWIGKTQARVNNAWIELESAPFLLNNRTMVPLRFITEPLGAKLQWDPVKQTIVLMFTA